MYVSVRLFESVIYTPLHKLLFFLAGSERHTLREVLKREGGIVSTGVNCCGHLRPLWTEAIPKAGCTHVDASFLRG